MVLAEAVRDLKLYFEDRYVILKNILYVPQMRRNLIYILCILEQIHKISFKINEAFIFYKGNQICSVILVNNLYKLDQSEQILS